jgi:FkbM family methyltransferase
MQGVIDVGANNGATCAEWLTTYPEAQIHAIEALDRYQPQLQSIAARSGGRMRIWQCAASDEAGEVTFFEHSEHPSSSSLLKGTSEAHDLLPFTRAERAHRVEAIPLDTLFLRENVDLPRGLLMKLDVQGAEAKVLHGARRTLNKVDAVLVEVNLRPLYEGQAAFEDLTHILDEANLRFAGVVEQFHGDDDRAIYFDALFLKAD